MSTRRGSPTQIAESVPFDNSDNGFISDNVQDAIEEVDNQILTSASPGFSYGRTGVTSKGAYLNNETVPSNVTGRYVYINNAIITRVFFSNENIGSYKLGVYCHDGDGVNNTQLGTVSVVSARGAEFTVSWAVDTGKQLAFRIEPDSPDKPSNPVAGLELSGTN